MDMRKVGNSDLMVSSLGIGCNNFGGRLDEAASHAVIHAALDIGVTLFDTADIYPMGVQGASETILGKGLGKRRNQAVLATKVGGPMDAEGKLKGGSKAYVLQAVEACLRRLGTDHIDLLQFHWPDPETPIEETLAAFDTLIKAGKVRYIGSSNVSGWQVVEAQFLARELGLARYVVTQEGYSLLDRKVETEVIPACQKYGVGLLPYFPLESGLLSGKYKSGRPAPEGSRLAGSKPLADKFLTEAKLARAGQLQAVVETAGLALIDLAFSWLLRDAVVPSVIAGASTPAQVERNARAVGHTLSPDILKAVAEI